MASAYSPEQLSQFLSYIQIPSKYHLERNPPRDIAFLTALHTYTLATVPYDNLALHYNPSHTIVLDPQFLFEKVVASARGRGGYCLENSTLHSNILRGLGFDAYPVGVRIRLRQDGVPMGDYMGCTHVIIVVTLDDGSKWMVDPGFGGDGATKPLPLIAGQITRNIGTQDIRLVRDFIPSQIQRSEERKLWIYQYRNGKDRPWNSFYAFSEHVELLPGDAQIMNWYTGSSPKSFQTTTALVVKFLRRPKSDSSGEDELYGKRMLVNGVVKENLSGKTNVVQVCKTEAERVQALKTWFGMDITASEIEGIKGWKTELC